MESLSDLRDGEVDIGDVGQASPLADRRFPIGLCTAVNIRVNYLGGERGDRARRQKRGDGVSPSLPTKRMHVPTRLLALALRRSGGSGGLHRRIFKKMMLIGDSPGPGVSEFRSSIARTSYDTLSLDDIFQSAGWRMHGPPEGGKAGAGEYYQRLSRWTPIPGVTAAA